MGEFGSYDPRRSTPGQHQLDKDFRSLFRQYSDSDTAPRSQHALPNSTIQWIINEYQAGSVRNQTTARLIVLAYYFLLRVGEYTPAENNKRNKRTIPLRKCDLRLFRKGVPLSLDADLPTLLQADGVTICLENQKNGKKDQTLYHDASDGPLMCPVKAAAHLIYQLRGLPQDTPLGSYRDDVTSTLGRVQAVEIRAMIRLGASADRLDEAGYDLSRIGSHSLRSGGAVRLKLAGAKDSLIKELGRWSGDTFRRYVQPYIGPIARGWAARMSVPLRFWNVHVR